MIGPTILATYPYGAKEISFCGSCSFSRSIFLWQVFFFPVHLLYQYAQITHWKIDESDHKPLIFSAQSSFHLLIHMSLVQCTFQPEINTKLAINGVIIYK